MIRIKVFTLYDIGSELEQWSHNGLCYVGAAAAGSEARLQVCLRLLYYVKG